MKIPLVFCYLALCPLAYAQSGAELLDKVISHPGSYSQVCSFLTSTLDAPYRAYQIHASNGVRFSNENQTKLKADRPAVIAAIRERLAKIDFSRKAELPPVDPQPEANHHGDPYGCDPKTLNPLILNLIIDLEVIEALPELLALEQRMTEEIARAQSNSTTPGPIVHGWGVGFSWNRGEYPTEENQNRASDLFQARVAQRDLLVTMQILMRLKQYPPALQTRIEKSYAEGLKKEAAENGWTKLKEDSPTEEMTAAGVERDPVTKLFRGKYFTVSVPYSPESRDEVRAAAMQWVGQHS